MCEAHPPTAEEAKPKKPSHDQAQGAGPQGRGGEAPEQTLDMNQVIFGLANDRTQVLNVMSALAEIGIASDQVSVLMMDRRESGALAEEIQAKAANGSFSAGNIGGGLGWLAGLSALAIPGIGLFFAAGPVLGFLAGIAIGRSLGNHRGAMIEEMGISDVAVDHYEKAMASGKIILAAQCGTPELAERASAAMQGAGMTDVASSLTAGIPAETTPGEPTTGGSTPVTGV